MKLRGKELYIIAAVVAVVVCAAWYFFFFSPIRSELSSLDEQLTSKESELVTTQADIQRLQALKKTSPRPKPTWSSCASCSRPRPRCRRSSSS